MGNGAGTRLLFHEYMGKAIKKFNEKYVDFLRKFTKMFAKKSMIVNRLLKIFAEQD
jgi:hypothetical protein